MQIKWKGRWMRCLLAVMILLILQGSVEATEVLQSPASNAEEGTTVSVTSEEPEIQCQIEVNGRRVSVHGTIQGAEPGCSLAFLAGTQEAPIHVCQLNTDVNGGFSCEFMVPWTLETGVYPYQIGVLGMEGNHCGTFEYENTGIPDITCRAYINHRHLVITGELLGAAQRPYTIGILVGTVQEPIAVLQIFSETNGTFEAAVGLPQNLLTGEYPYHVGVMEDTEMFADTFYFDASTAPDPEPEPEEAEKAFYVFNGKSNDTFELIAIGLHMKPKASQRFQLRYSSVQIHPTHFYGFYSQPSLEIGKKGNIEILSHQDGIITFQIIEEGDIPAMKRMDKILNIFGFQFNTDYRGSTLLVLEQID